MSHLFAQLRLAWRLELHFTFALKHLQRFVLHFLAPVLHCNYILGNPVHHKQIVRVLQCATTPDSLS